MPHMGPSPCDTLPKQSQESSRISQFCWHTTWPAPQGTGQVWPSQHHTQLCWALWLPQLTSPQPLHPSRPMAKHMYVWVGVGLEGDLFSPYVIYSLLKIPNPSMEVSTKQLFLLLCSKSTLSIWPSWGWQTWGRQIWVLDTMSNSK